MDPSIRAYAQLRLAQAHEELETAHENLEHGRLRAALSRAYYAIFYVASAALFSHSVVRSKHSGIESAFSEHLIRTGEIEPEYGRLYHKARRLREEADYAEQMPLELESVRQTITEAERFVDRLEEYLRERGAV